jgi:hypothetical protein
MEGANGLVWQAQAHDAAALADHQRHTFDVKFFRRVNQVGFVLAIVVVEQGDRAAFSQRLQGSGYSGRDSDGSVACTKLRKIGKRGGRGGEAGN